MNNSQLKSNAKRQRNDDQYPSPHKVQRCRFESPPAIIQPTKIIDLNDDCLMKIFGYLDLLNLFYVAIANEFLRPAAAIVYKRKFGTKSIEIFRAHGAPNTRASARNKSQNQFAVPKEWTCSIDIRSPRLCLQYIRCFGPSFATLRIYYNQSTSNFYEQLHHYINEYCSKSLIEIGFWSKSNHPIEHFVKPFVSVKNVNVSYGNFGKQLPTFAEWFPSLSHLELHDVRLNPRSSMALHFQYLEHICIDDFNDLSLSDADTIKLIQSSRQLKSIEIRVELFKIPIQTLLGIIKDGNHSINKLALTHECGLMRVDSIVVQRFINELPSLVELNMPHHEFQLNDAITLIQQLKSLKMFAFYMENVSDFHKLRAQLDEQWRSRCYYNLVTLNRD